MTSPSQKVAGLFARDVAEHAMTVLVDCGLYRHLRFAAPGTSCGRFDVITWPGSLCFTGDMGTFVFARIADMFEFFRTSEGRGPNFGYWSEKVVAADRSDGLRVFSPALFRNAVAADLRAYIDDHQVSGSARRDLWESARTALLESAYGWDLGAALAAVEAFESDGDPVFQDFYEHRLEEFSGRFYWCCFALPWAIARYDAARHSEPSTVSEVA